MKTGQNNQRPPSLLSCRARLFAPVFAASGLIATRRPTTLRARQPRSLTVALDWYPNVDHVGFYLAQAHGYFAAAGLNVEFYTPADPATILQTVGAGADDLGISYQPDVLLARAQEVPVVSVAALLQQPLLGIMALEEAGISRPGDLAGKTVGYPGIPYEEAMLAAMLEADGSSLEDVDLVNVGFNLVPATLSGRAAAVMGAYRTVEPILAEREGRAVDFLPVEAWGVPDYYELVLVASEETVATDGATIRAFLGAAQQGHADAIADPEAALDALVAASPDVDRAVAAQGLPILMRAWTDGVPAFGTQTAERWRELATWMQDRGLLPDDLDVDPAWTGAFTPTAESTPAASPAATPAG